MSVADTLFLISSLEACLTHLDGEKKQIKSDLDTLRKDLLGEIDRTLIEDLQSRGEKVQTFEVDGLTWYLVSIKVFLLKSEQAGFDPIIKDRKDHGRTVMVPCDKSHCPIPVELFPDLFHAKYSYYPDAMVLTDCRGHRMHTKHSYEGYRASPHWAPDGGGCYFWGGGHGDFETVTTKAIRAYVERLCYEQKRQG